MEIHSADFVSSFTQVGDCPKDGRPEFAFIGRSNVGKSSLINMLTAKKGLAKVSQTPGKTQLINFFSINQKWYLVDLPGYGYAKVSKTQQKTLAKMIDGYLSNRLNMVVAFVLVDGTIPPTKIDQAFVDALGEKQVPFALVFTKADRVKPGELERNVQAFFKEMEKRWDTIPPFFITSSQHKTGRQEILDFIGEAMKK